MSLSDLDSDEEQLMAFYPDRFVGARVPNAKTREYTLVDLDEVRSSGSAGVVRAARRAPTPARKRRRQSAAAKNSDNERDESGDGDDDDDDDASNDGSGKLPVTSRDPIAKQRAAAAPPAQSKQKPRSRLRMAMRYSAKRSKARILKSPAVMQAEQPSIVTLTSREIAWSTAEVLMVEYVSKRVPIVAACIATIKNQVMREGIRFNRDAVELIPSTEFQQYVTQRLVPFCHQCIDALLLLGVVPILYEREERTGQPWPYVPAIGTYVIKRHSVAGATRLRFYWRNNALQNASWQKQMLRTRDRQGMEAWVARRVYEPRTPEQTDEAGGIYDPTVEIMHGFGYDMTTNGLLGSKVASLLTMVEQRMRHMFARATGEMNAANPPVFTEYNLAAEKQNSKSFQTGYFTSASVPLDSTGTGNGGTEQDLEGLAGRTYTRDIAAREAYAGLLRTVEQDTGASASAMFSVRPDEYKSDLGGTAVVQNAFSADGYPHPWQRQFHVSSSRVLKAGPKANFSTDYVNVLMHLDEEVCAVFGVPLTYLLGTSIRAGTDLVVNRLGEEISSYKKICGDILTHVYNMLFLSEDIRSYLTSDQRRQRQPRFNNNGAAGGRGGGADGTADGVGGVVTEEDLFVSEAIGSVQVSFPKNPVERIDELQQLYALGAISLQVFCTEIARRNGIEPSQLFLDEAADVEVETEMRQMAFAPYADYIKLKHAERMDKRRLDAAAEMAEDAQSATAELAEKAQAATADKAREAAAESASAKSPAKKK